MPACRRNAAYKRREDRCRCYNVCSAHARRGVGYAARQRFVMCGHSSVVAGTACRTAYNRVQEASSATADAMPEGTNQRNGATYAVSMVTCDAMYRRRAPRVGTALRVMFAHMAAAARLCHGTRYRPERRLNQHLRYGNARSHVTGAPCGAQCQCGVRTTATTQRVGYMPGNSQTRSCHNIKIRGVRQTSAITCF